MDNLTKTIIVLGSILLIVITIGFVIQTINKSSVNSNSIIIKAQHKFTSSETNAIENSSIPITINPANALVFGSWKNTSVRICGQEQANFSVENSSNLYVLNNGFYVPTYEVVKALGNSNPNLISKKVYLSFIDANMKPSINTSALYIIKSENIESNEVIWKMSFDGNISNAINPNNATELSKTISWLNGVILLNGTSIISPRNPYIDNGKFISNYSC